MNIVELTYDEMCTLSEHIAEAVYEGKTLKIATDAHNYVMYKISGGMWSPPVGH